MVILILTVALLIEVPLISLRLLIHGLVPLWKRMGDASYVIYLVYWVLVDLLILPYVGDLAALRFKPFQLDFVSVIGLFIVLFGFFFGYWTTRTLGLIAFSMRPELSPEKVTADLIISGPYCYLRHPFYFTEWILLFGFSLVTGSTVMLGLLAAAILIDPIVTFLEEKDLKERFGENFSVYQKKVPRLIPNFPNLKGR